MPLGVCYYPEHWPQERWAIDARMMRETGLEYVRIGEFAWAKLEPEPGVYDWEWLDTAIETLHAAGLAVVLGTPTATPPAWLSAANPDWLRVGADGRRFSHGGRRHMCLSGSGYRAACRTITAALVERYGQHPAVAAWQIDNELGNHGSARCYCQTCRAAWQRWLEDSFGTLEALNSAWGTVFWSQTYTAWEQVPLPADPVGGGHNPALSLAYRRFASAIQVDFCAEQALLVRAGAPGRTILTNIAPGDDEIDWFDLAATVDVIAWDNYPHGFADWSAVALFHEHVHGLKRQPFWVMEQQPGPINWTPTNPPVPPGQVRAWTYQDAAHGAASVLYFRWRACRLAQEQYHSGLLDHSAEPARGLSEAAQVAREWATLGPPIPAPHTVALLVDYSDLWAHQLDPHAQGWHYWRLVQTIYRSLTAQGIGVDVVRRGSDLAPYRLAVAVAPMLINDAEGDHWRQWVAQGGTLVVTPRAFTKDQANCWTDQRLPGGLVDLFGAEVAEWTALDPAAPWQVVWNDDPSPITVPLWAEVLEPALANPLVRYHEGYAAGKAAVTAATYGKGMAILCGAYPTSELLAGLWPRLLPEASQLPPSIERIALEDGILLINHSPRAVRVALQGSWRDRLTDQVIQTGLDLAGFDVVWLTPQAAPST